MSPQIRAERVSSMAEVVSRVMECWVCRRGVHSEYWSRRLCMGVSCSAEVVFSMRSMGWRVNMGG